MPVSFSPELERSIREKVERGLYPSADEVIQEALSLLEDRDRLRAWKLEELRAEIAIGIAQADRGGSAPLDMAAFRAEVARRLDDQTVQS